MTRGKAELVEGSALFCRPTVGASVTALRAFSREETTRWQHACKTLRREEKKRSLGLVKKTQESCFTAGQQMLLTRLRCQSAAASARGSGCCGKNFARSPRSIESARHMVWQGYPSTSVFVSGWMLFALRLYMNSRRMVNIPKTCLGGLFLGGMAPFNSCAVVPNQNHVTLMSESKGASRTAALM